MFFGIWIAATFVGAILIDDDGRYPWSSGFFVTLSWMMLT